MRKKLFTVDFQNKETKTESSRPGFGQGFCCQKGCEAPRRDGPEGATAVRSLRREAGGPPKRVRSTEGEHAAQRQRSPKPATRSGQAISAKHRGRVRRAAGAVRSLRREAGQAAKSAKHRDEDGPERATAVRSPRRKAGGGPQKVRSTEGNTPRSGSAVEARDAKRGGPPKRVRSTEGKHAAQRQRSPKPATRSGAGRKKGAKPVTRRGTGCRRAFYIHFP